MVFIISVSAVYLEMEIKLECLLILRILYLLCKLGFNIKEFIGVFALNYDEIG
jgi:hypothetical protein